MRDPKKGCSVEGCTPRGRIRQGMCGLHYQRWKKHGDPLKSLHVPHGTRYKQCAAEGCTAVVGITGAKGFCGMHYMRWRKHGDPLKLVRLPSGTRDQVCLIEGCTKLVGRSGARGWCYIHYSRWRRHGDPEKFIGSGALKGVRRQTPSPQVTLPKYKPTSDQIAWAAGLWEGEGSICSKRADCYNSDRWVLERLQEWFGGHIGDRSRWEKPVTENSGPLKPAYHWQLGGPYGRAFLKAIWQWLSPRRRVQINKWDWGKPPWAESELPVK